MSASIIMFVGEHPGTEISKVATDATIDVHLDLALAQASSDLPNKQR